MMNLKERIFWLLMAGCLISFLITFPGCKPLEKIEYVTKYDTCYVSKSSMDSIVIRDSIIVKEKQDTIYVDRWHFNEHTAIKYDTIYKYRVDTLKVPVIEEKVVEKEKELNIFQKIMIYIGFAFIIYLILKISKRFK